MKKILVVEDGEIERELLKLTLEREGYLVVAAEDGVSGYDLAVAERPDLIITDVSMPAADGIQLVRHVRDTPGLDSTPILVTTGFGTGSATFTMGQGADAFEPKPLDPDSLRATVRRLLA